MTDAPGTIDATWIEAVTYDWLSDDGGARTGIHAGGTRSGKTYQICIAWIEHLLEAPALLSIVRGTGPALKATVRRDFLEVARALGVYDIDKHNRTDDILTLPGGGQVEFFATDDEQKVHGRKRAHLWCNEANEIPESSFVQMILRTTGRVCLDFNPSMREDHWIWKRYDDSEDVIRWQSTYLDNPFLTDAQVREIEALKELDEWAWQVYGLGMRGVPADAIFRAVQPLPTFPPDLEEVYGLDFGYNDPMALCKLARRDREGKADVYVWSLLHESYLTTGDLIERMKDMDIPARAPIYCDAAEPDRIEEIRRAGFNAKAADKGPGSVRAGIDYMKRHRIHVGGPAGQAARNEWSAYRWKKVRGVIQDEPAHDGSNACDSARYGLFSHFVNKANLQLRVF